MKPLSKEEKLVISRLRRLAKDFPKSLWLFSAQGEIHVMRLDEDGERYVNPDGGMSQEAIVASVNIPSDGGDW